MRFYLFFLLVFLWAQAPTLACQDGVVCNEPECPQASKFQAQERATKKTKYNHASIAILNAVDAYLSANAVQLPFPVTASIVQEHPELMSTIAERILNRKTFLTTSRLLRIVHQADRVLFKILFRDTYLDLLSQTKLGDQSGCILFNFLNPHDVGIIKEFVGTDLINHRTANGNNLAHFAAMKGKTEALEFLAKNIPELVFQVNDVGNNPLHLAALHGHSETVQALLMNSIELASETNFQGESPFLLALRSLNEASIVYFREHLANNPEVILAFGRPQLNRVLFPDAN